MHDVETAKSVLILKSVTPHQLPDLTHYDVGACMQTSDERTEPALRQSEARYRALYNQTPVMMLSIDPHGHILNVNDYWLQNLGYTRDEVLGHQSMAFMTTASRHHAMTVSRPHFLQTGAVQDVPYQMVKKNGEVIDVLLSGIAERNAAGDIIAGHAFMVDVTAQKRAEAAINTLQRENRYLQDEIKTTHNFEEIIGTSPALLHVLKQVEQVAGTDTTVLITGETGTGKELIVRALHHLSPRKDRPLIKVNCTALSAGLIESELFGHEKGAFTGAIARKLGRFELADGGTLFLDEIGDMPLEVQAKLLRVLQEGEFERVGSAQTLPSNVRVIAATNRELKQAVAANEFRADLFYRLHVFPIHLPPLRQRTEDIPLLVQYFVDKSMRSLGKRIETIETATMERLIAYPWPGNIRELEHLIERALILTRSSTLVIDDALLSAAHVLPLDTCVAATQEVRQTSPTLEEVERDYIVATLETTGWVVEGRKGAARILDLHPNTLRGRMRRLGISRPCRSA